MENETPGTLTIMVLFTIGFILVLLAPGDQVAHRLRQEAA